MSYNEEVPEHLATVLRDSLSNGDYSLLLDCLPEQNRTLRERLKERMAFQPGAHTSSSGLTKEIVENLVASLRQQQHHPELDDFMEIKLQEVLDLEGGPAVREMFEVLRRRAERRQRRVVIYTATVDRSLSPRQFLKASGRTFRTEEKNLEVFDTMPRQTERPSNVEVHFCYHGRVLMREEREKELADMGLEQDYYAQFQVNIEHRLFAVKRRNAMHWRDAFDRACCVAFVGDADLLCDNMGYRWDYSYWSAGCPVK